MKWPVAVSFTVGIRYEHINMERRNVFKMTEILPYAYYSYFYHQE